MSKFKVGDTVICLDFSGSTGEDLLKLGSNSIHHISQLDSPTNYKFVKISGMNEWILSNRFELFVEEKVVETPKENMGIRLNNGKLRWRNFPMFLMEPVIAVGSYAEKREGNPNGKYETFNFLKGMYVNDCMDSLRRHFKSFESPYESDNDLESQESHLAHIAWNALVALHMLKTRPELDDRFKLPETKKEVALSEEEKFEAAESIQTRGR